VKFWKSAKAADTDARFRETNLFEARRKTSPRWTQSLSSMPINWRFERLAAIDRAILRLAIHEMNGTGETPPKVVLNEAVEHGERSFPRKIQEHS